jgi:hypothetical protein
MAVALFNSAPGLGRFVAAAAIQARAGTKAPTRRALLVGINNYDRLHQPPSSRETRSGRGSESPLDSPKLFGHLDGPLNDVQEIAKILELRRGYSRENIHLLPEKEATHDGILAAIQRYLIDEAAPGDECFFYFGGHGSFIINSKSEQPNKQDETIVPIDYVRPIQSRDQVKDIRDKELVQYFNRALDKGIVLTVIVDSCHSGSIARGDNTVRARTGPAGQFDIAEPPPADPDRSRKPADRGALILSAALAEQPANEREYDGVYYGDFTRALTEVLSSASADVLTAEQFFQQVSARMRSRGIPAEPSLDANNDRRKRTLFGSPASNTARPQILACVRVDLVKGDVLLDKGRAFSITEGSEFIQKTGIALGAGSVRLRITKAEMTGSVAAPIPSAGIRKVKVGDTFEQDKWAASKDSISIWLPPSSLTAAEVKRVAQEMASLRDSDRVRIVDDPTREVATHRLYFDGTDWRLDLPAGASENLGRAPAAQAVIEKAGATPNNKARLFVSLPLINELKDRIKLGPGTPKNAVNLASSENGASYKLIGRSADGGASIEYCWVLPGAIKAETEAERLARQSGLTSSEPEPKPSPLPPITDWVKSGDNSETLSATARRLEDLALTLNKISGWVTLQAPQDSATMDSPFPFHLTLLNRDGTPVRDKLIEDETYQVALVADKTAPQGGSTEQRWVYVISIDKYGRTSLLYPTDVGIGNQYPKLVDNKPQFDVPPLGLFQVVGPSNGGVLGPETYILLATRERLADAKALEFEGVRTAEETRSDKASRGAPGQAASPLDDLLEELGSVSRSAVPKTTAANWSVQQLFRVSVPKSR